MLDRALLAALVACLLFPGAASAAPAACPATFDVRVPARIDTLVVPAGAYRLTVIDGSGLDCSVAADLFRQFLGAWEGGLPDPWRFDVSTRTFHRGGGAGFSFDRVGPSAGGGQYPAQGVRCPEAFRVLEAQRIGELRVPAGAWSLTLLSTTAFDCRRAAERLHRFLSDFDGHLPGRWLLDARTGTFLRGIDVGFTLARSVSPPPAADTAWTFPAPRTRCAGAVRVPHDTRLGRLRVPAGAYTLTRTAAAGPSCAAARRSLRRLLGRRSLPTGWRLSRGTATVTRRDGTGFRVKPGLR